MAPIQAVLVSSPDEDLVASLTATLRDQWPVRTATTVQETETSLDESVTVVIFDPAFESLSVADLTAIVETSSPDAQLLQYGTSVNPTAETADAVLEQVAETETIRSTVDRLQRRVRYAKLLSRFYALARSRSERDTAVETEEPSTELAELKRELDELAAELDDEDIFDVALGQNNEDRR
ncbi:HoxA-like transcriptional regulator protein [Halorhabdus tiamatea SARL4B]|nr:hypothetical protein [Halorhabdus tiamatea]ERJ05545.1 HoxA-like transcriptional regulator protein [Halorhabdus tiamatea SARL4B]